MKCILMKCDNVRHYTPMFPEYLIEHIVNCNACFFGSINYLGLMRIDHGIDEMEWGSFQ